jgi:hypothetical protein
VERDRRIHHCEPRSFVGIRDVRSAGMRPFNATAEPRLRRAKPTLPSAQHQHGKAEREQGEDELQAGMRKREYIECRVTDLESEPSDGQSPRAARRELGSSARNLRSGIDRDRGAQRGDIHTRHRSPGREHRHSRYRAAPSDQRFQCALERLCIACPAFAVARAAFVCEINEPAIT